MNHFNIIIRPIVTEKMTSLGKEGVYGFYVHEKATKIDVKNAVRALYGTEVAKVNMLLRQGKTKLVARGHTAAKRRQLKKALVTLKGRKTIDVYKMKSK